MKRIPAVTLSLLATLGAASNAAWALSPLVCSIDEGRLADGGSVRLVQSLGENDVPETGVAEQRWALGGRDGAFSLIATVLPGEVEFRLVDLRRDAVLSSMFVRNESDTSYNRIELTIPLPKGLLARQKLLHVSCSRASE